MVKINKIRKRDGSIEAFLPEKIQIAIQKALTATKKNPKIANKITPIVVKELEKHFPPKILPTVEDIQDIAEETLIKNKLIETAKAYILYREKHKEIREFKTFLGIRDELKLSPNSLRVLAARYLLRDANGNIIETPARLFRRVAKAAAQGDSLYGKGTLKKIEEEFYKLLSSRDFLPNTPTLMNAGTTLGQLSACFVLPVGDSLTEIFDTLKHMAIIHQSGGGTGFSFSKLRPRNDIVMSTKGPASGPVSFMRIFDMTTEVIKQGGKRRGANMGILSSDHPDIIEFITSKSKEETLRNFNISVSATDAFMEAALKNKPWPLINPRTRKIVQTANAKELFDLICANASRLGDPGMIFIDEINRKNPTSSTGLIESTNPCGEQPLHPYESCNLGSINLTNMEESGKLNWEKLKKTIRTAVHFLDNIIDINKYPLPHIEEITKSNRRIGLGVMGFAELLINLKIAYDSPQAITFSEKIAKFIQEEARKASQDLGKERGNFPNFEQSTLKTKYKTMRNATVTTIAPTGTISIIAGATSGIEPLFAVSFVRDVLEGTYLLEVNPSFERIAKQKKFYNKTLMMQIAKKGTVKNIKGISRDIQKLFKTALEIPYEQHIKIQAAWQKHIDNAVSKTINLPNTATPEDIKKAYLLAHKLKCKGITVYRYASKKEQVLYLGGDITSAGPEFSGGHECGECNF